MLLSSLLLVRLSFQVSSFLIAHQHSKGHSVSCWVFKCKPLSPNKQCQSTEGWILRYQYPHGVVVNALVSGKWSSCSLGLVTTRMGDM